MFFKNTIIVLSSLFCILMIFSCSGGSAVKDENKYFAIEEEETKIVEIKKYKAVIFPFEYISSKTKFKKPDLLKTILFNAFYSFLSILPTLEVPDKSELQEINNLNPSDIAERYNADFIVYGSYMLEGSLSSPEATVHLFIWSKITKSVISNDYKIPTDEEIFDSIDDISSKIVKAILKEDKRIAFLNFGNFKIAPEEYELYINDRLVAKPSNSSFSLNTKILSDTEYKIRLHRLSDDVTVLNNTCQLKAGETTNIGFMTNSILITGFEDNPSQKVVVFSYSWTVDSVTYSIINNLPNLNIKEGKKALSVTISVEGNSGGAGLKLTPKQGSWEGYKALSMWVAGNLKYKNYVLYVIDAGGEVFFYRVSGGWDGWKRITIPFEKMRRTRLYSPYGAVYNRIMDFPIREIRLCSVGIEEGGRLGDYSLYFDQVEVYR